MLQMANKMRKNKGVTYTPEYELNVPCLNSNEKRWINRLQKILSDCPERLEIVTIGDPGLSIIDSSALKNLDNISDGKAYENGYVLADITGGPKVHGVSG